MNAGHLTTRKRNRNSCDLLMLNAQRGDRYGEPAEMELRFSWQRRGVTYFGTGHALQLTNTAVLIESDQELPMRGEIELRVNWPFLLNGVCPLELVIQGQMGTPEGTLNLISIRSYEFKTCGCHSFEPAAGRAITCDWTV